MLKPASIDAITSMHYQFEAIHPFTDGNGRTERILNILYLVQEELLGLPILYLSRYIIANKSQYYSNLVEANIAKRQTASEYLKRLVSIGVLTEQQVGRERLFVHPRLIELITRDANSFVKYET
ncbi:MAG: Fic family protein [Amphritea sp.]